MIKQTECESSRTSGGYHRQSIAPRFPWIRRQPRPRGRRDGSALLLPHSIQACRQLLSLVYGGREGTVKRLYTFLRDGRFLLAAFGIETKEFSTIPHVRRIQVKAIDGRPEWNGVKAALIKSVEPFDSTI